MKTNSPVFLLPLLAGLWYCGAAGGADGGKLPSYSDYPTFESVKYAKACGPIACFAALRALQVEVSMDEVVSKCDWSEGKTTTLQTMQDVLSSFSSVVSIPAKLTPETLVKYLDQGYVAILAVRKFSEKIDHVIVGVGTVNANLVAVDYPELRRSINIETLCDSWDGEVLLLHQARTDGTRSTAKALMASVVGITGVIVLAMGVRRMRLVGGNQPIA
jgi:hypothetical protein